MMPCPLFIELCAGTAAVSLRLHGGESARPPVSRMGAKTGYATAILRVLGLRPGQGYTDGTQYLWCEPDAGVRLLLEAYRDRELAQAAAEIIRSWKDEEPRALWERLRAEGPPKGLEPREVARWVFDAGNCYGALSPMGGWKPPPPAATTGCNASPLGLASSLAGGTRNDRWQSVPLAGLFRGATIHPDARRVDPREVARWAVLGQSAYRKGEPESGYDDIAARAGSTRGICLKPAETVGRRWLVTTLPATIHPDAREVEPPPLSREVVAYMDPPYVGTTGYADALPREDVVMLARRWDAAGATVCISEAEPIPELVADGWHAVEITSERKGQRRTFSKQQAEWLTLNREPAWAPSVQASLFGAV